MPAFLVVAASVKERKNSGYIYAFIRNFNRRNFRIKD